MDAHPTFIGKCKTGWPDCYYITMRGALEVAEGKGKWQKNVCQKYIQICIIMLSRYIVMSICPEYGSIDRILAGTYFGRCFRILSYVKMSTNISLYVSMYYQLYVFEIIEPSLLHQLFMVKFIALYVQYNND